MPCPICTFNYTLCHGNERIPRLLYPCCHSICNQCLQKLIYDAKIQNTPFKCPYCNLRYTDLNMETYRTNYALVELIENNSVYLVSNLGGSGFLVPNQVALHSQFIESVIGNG